MAEPTYILRPDMGGALDTGILQRATECTWRRVNMPQIVQLHVCDGGLARRRAVWGGARCALVRLGPRTRAEPSERPA